MSNQDNIIHIVSKPEVGQQFETFCLNELKAELKTYAEQELAKRGRSHVHVEIFKDFYDEKFWVHTDRKCLKQILVILLDNAVKHTDRGAIMFDFHITISNHIHFFVDDTGDGIYDENDPNLAIAQGLIRQLGGEMEVIPSTIADAGISFNFTIAGKPFDLNEN
jgi:K+-sensing histidine kinase KdpD